AVSARSRPTWPARGPSCSTSRAWRRGRRRARAGGPSPTRCDSQWGSTLGGTVAAALGVLVGLDDRDGNTRGLGWVSDLDVAAARLTVETAVAGEGIAAGPIGWERYRAA